MQRIAIAAAALLASTVTPADNLAGDPITPNSLADTMEIVRIADALDAAVDAKDWQLARSFFTDQIEVDFTSLTGGEPATIAADGLIDGWSANLTAEKTSFHLRGNHRVSWTGDRNATLHSHGYAWNRLERGALPENGGNALWEVWGTYEHRFVRTSRGWRVQFMGFYMTAERGNEFVRNTPGNP